MHEGKIAKIVLGGGCFWGLQDLIRKQPGVIETTVGYAGGTLPNPTYENHGHASMDTARHDSAESHTEVVEISYDTEMTSLKKILDFFFQIHNPTTMNQQGNDRGISYRSVIFYSTEEEKQEALDFIKIVNDSKRWPNPVVTAVEPFTFYTKGEDYHQDYLQKNPGGYTCHAIWFDSYL